MPRQYGPLLLRFALGGMWISHALLKVLVFTLPGAAAFFESKGIPGGFVYPVVAAELLGGLAIIAGVYARQVALLLLPILVGALVVHLPNGWVFTAEGGGWEYPLFLIAMSFVLWLSDDGAFAVRRTTRAAAGAQA